jgi:membrane protein implicated in regulation of membrane protease activity
MAWAIASCQAIKMRSITVKLLLAFLAISMLSVMLIVLSARWLTEREFRSYLFTQNRNSIITALADYYIRTEAGMVLM